MERVLVRSILFTFFLFSINLFSSAQDLTGIWKGYFITNDGEQYKLEFQVKQNNSSSITGVSYSYLDVRFYGKATMSGSLNRTEKQFQVQELRTVEVKNLSGGGTCLMKYIFTYDKSGKEEFLEGTFVGKSEDRKNPQNDGNWGDCGGGKVYLRRVQSSDFYVEPFLRDNPKPRDNPKLNTIDSKLKSPPPIVKKSPVKTNPATTPKTNHPIKNNHATVKNKPVVIRPNNNSVTDSIKTKISPDIKNLGSQKKSITPDILKTRENALARTITVNTEEVSIKLYDNGEIDGDSISVFVDGKLTLSHKGLSASPITLTLKFDEDNSEHEVIMVAENLGRIPPNTSLMVIDAGDKRYHVQITSTEQKNAMVRFKYDQTSQ